MSKAELKKEMARTKGNKCNLTNEVLPDDTSLFDTHRTIPKRKGGVYLVDNTNVVTPRAHMAVHKNLRIREPELEILKGMVDDRRQVMKVVFKINNQLLARKRHTDIMSEETVNFLKQQLLPLEKKLEELTKPIAPYIRKMKNPLVTAALSVKGVGEITVAHCLVYIDLEKADHASSLWSYCGLDKASHERYTKGKSGGGNKTLRTSLYTMAESQVRIKGAAYQNIYYQVKERLYKSEKIVKSRPTEGDKMVEVAWKDTMPSHRHGAALRAVMKHFLADYWMVGRTLLGLPTSALYPEAILGGTHRTIMPEERGWAY